MTRTAPANVPPPSAGQVSMLQAVRGYPCVTVLMTTTPASRMTQPDVDRLRSLTREAARRMDEERLAGTEPTVVQAPQRLAGDAAAEPTGAAVALYASRAMATSLRLPVPVRDRVVVDPTFATRDLVRSLHRTPRHVVLTLTGADARLFDGAAGDLRPALRSAFPRHNTLPRPRDGHHAGRREAGAARFFRDVDQALGGYLRLHPAPLILVGPERALSTFRPVSRNLQRLAGSVTRSHASTPLPELARLISPILDAYLHSRHQDALALLDRRAGADRLVSGMPGAWLAPRRRAAGL
jgi:Bacterial archaeo-eukaryotic release factor family 3